MLDASEGSVNGSDSAAYLRKRSGATNQGLISLEKAADLIEKADCWAVEERVCRALHPETPLSEAEICPSWP